MGDGPAYSSVWVTFRRRTMPSRDIVAMCLPPWKNFAMVNPRPFCADGLTSSARIQSDRSKFLCHQMEWSRVAMEASGCAQ